MLLEDQPKKIIIKLLIINLAKKTSVLQRHFCPCLRLVNMIVHVMKENLLIDFINGNYLIMGYVFQSEITK